MLNEVVLNQVAIACGEGPEARRADAGGARARCRPRARPIRATGAGAGGRSSASRCRRARPRSRTASGRRRRSSRPGGGCAGGHERGGPAIEARGLEPDVPDRRRAGARAEGRDAQRSARGDFVSFIGPSGCGKTTFLRVAADLEPPTGGTITVNGMSPAAARQARAYGYVFQAAGLFPVAHASAATCGCRSRSWAIGRAEQAARVRAGARAGRARRLREEVSLAALGGHAAAGVDRAGAGVRRRHPADGRAVRGARRDRARPAERGAAGALGADRQDHRLRHPLDPGGGVSSRPGSW